MSIPFHTVIWPWECYSKEEMQDRKKKLCSKIPIVKDVHVVYCFLFLNSLKQPKHPRIEKTISKQLCQLNTSLYITKMRPKKICCTDKYS